MLGWLLPTTPDAAIPGQRNSNPGFIRIWRAFPRCVAYEAYTRSAGAARRCWLVVGKLLVALATVKDIAEVERERDIQQGFVLGLKTA